MEAPNLDGMVTCFIMALVITALLTWGAVELVYWAFIDDAIRSTEPIIPEIELVVKDNVVDTIYVYRKPN